jgi:hypothetical protein
MRNSAPIAIRVSVPHLSSFLLYSIQFAFSYNLQPHLREMGLHDRSAKSSEAFPG